MFSNTTVKPRLGWVYGNIESQYDFPQYNFFLIIIKDIAIIQKTRRIVKRNPIKINTFCVGVRNERPKRRHEHVIILPVIRLYKPFTIELVVDLLTFHSTLSTLIIYRLCRNTII